jgi:hypothetical protein
VFTLPHLPVERQRNVGNALEALFKSKPRYTQAVAARARAVIEATALLPRSPGTTIFTVDNATDGVISSIFHIVEAFDRSYASTLVPLDAEQQAQQQAARLIEHEWFADGPGFIHKSVGLQLDIMVAMKESLADETKGPALKAAIDLLGLSPLVGRLLAHIDLYARTLGQAGKVVTDVAPADPGDAWHGLYVAFAIDATSAYADDPAALATLLGPYEAQLKEYRRDQAKARRKAKAAQAAMAAADTPDPAKPGGGPA